MDKSNESLYEQAWKSLIKPEKLSYSLENVGFSQYHYGPNKGYKRYNIRINLFHNSFVNGYLFVPINLTKKFNNNKINLNYQNIIIYLHSHGSTCLEGIEILEYLFNNEDNNISLFVFDSVGSGLSSGNYVTLGWNESLHLEKIIDTLQNNYKAGRVSLWGRSMGAVTCIIYISRNSNMIDSVILDSPFSDIETMIKDLAYSNIKMPQILTQIGLIFLKKKIKSEINFDISLLKPIEFAKLCNVSALFLCGRNDTLVPEQRIKDIYNNYYSKNKHIIYSNKMHHESPEPSVIKECINFIKHEFNNYKLINNIYSHKKETIISELNNNPKINKLCKEILSKDKRNIYVIDENNCNNNDSVLTKKIYLSSYFSNI